MKSVLGSLATAIALAGFISMTGCGDGAGDNDGADTTAMDTAGIDVDSGAGGTEVSVDEKNYSFEGTVSSVSGDQVTIDHEEISDYKPAGSNTFKLASAEMAQHVKKGDRVDVKLKVVGEEALVTTIDIDTDTNDADTTGGDNARSGDDRSGDMDTIGRNEGTEKK